MSDEGGVTPADLCLERRTKAVTPWSCKGALGGQWLPHGNATGHSTGESRLSKRVQRSDTDNSAAW